MDCVGEDDKLKQMRNGADGQTNDVNSVTWVLQGPPKVSHVGVDTQEPLKASCARHGKERKPKEALCKHSLS